MMLAIGGITVFSTGAFVEKRSKHLLFILTFITFLAALVGALLSDGGTATFMRMLDVGSYARFFNVLFALAALLFLCFSHQHAGLQPVRRDEFYGLAIFAVLGMSLTANAENWLIFFLGFELLSLSFYVLITLCRNDPLGNEAALKYMIMGMVAGGFLVFGIAMFYAASGSLDMTESLGASGKLVNASLSLLALGLILTAVGFKISLVPFHLWTPDVYQGTPSPVTALLTTGSKIAVFAAWLRITLTMSDWLWAHCVPVIWVIAAATMFAGNITALAQTNLKRLLAYSSIAQMGYLFMTMLAVRSEGGVIAVIFYFVVYTLMDMGAFGIIATFCSGSGKEMDDLNRYQGIGYTCPWQAAILTLCLLSLAGLPPTAGFMGKFIIFKAVLQARYIGLAILGIVAACLSLFVYLKVLSTIYMQPAAMKMDCPVSSFGMAARCATAVILFGILWLGMFPSSLLTVIARAAVL